MTNPKVPASIRRLITAGARSPFPMISVHPGLSHITMAPMFGIDSFEIIHLLIPLAGVVILFWLAITALRALNVYIARNGAAFPDRHHVESEFRG